MTFVSCFGRLRVWDQTSVTYLTTPFTCGNCGQHGVERARITVRRRELVCELKRWARTLQREWNRPVGQSCPVASRSAKWTAAQ